MISNKQSAHLTTLRRSFRGPREWHAPSVVRQNSSRRVAGVTLFGDDCGEGQLPDAGDHVRYLRLETYCVIGHEEGQDRLSFWPRGSLARGYSEERYPLIPIV